MCCCYNEAIKPSAKVVELIDATVKLLGPLSRELRARCCRVECPNLAMERCAALSGYDGYRPWRGLEGRSGARRYIGAVEGYDRNNMAL
jgi:hypothetical protein